MDTAALKAFIRAVSKEKDLPAEILKDAIEHSILSASRKQLSRYRDAVPKLDLDAGTLTVMVTKTVTEDAPKGDHEHIGLKEACKATGNRNLKVGEEVRVDIDPGEFGRIAAQSVRQMVTQRLRDAERTKVYEEYKDKEGIMVTGIVQRFERRDVMLNIGRAEGILLASEQPSGAHYKFNDRLKVLIVRVEKTSRGPAIILSRKSPQLVIELFRQEVPEIADGTVQIVGIAREAGVRTKIAVKSANSDVDPVGACVGMKGSRVQMVVRELENEKIDIVPWSMDTSTFIRNALNPAKIVGIELQEDQRRANVTVAQGNLAIAIGRKGQNTKLAAKLSGYRLDIRSENEEELAYEEIQRRYLSDFLDQIEGLPDLYQQAILRSNFNSVDKIAKADPLRLMPFTGDNEAMVQSMIEGARVYLVALHEMEQERRQQREGEGEEAKKAEGEEATAETTQDAAADPATETEGATESDQEDAKGEEATAEATQDAAADPATEPEEVTEPDQEAAEGEEATAEATQDAAADPATEPEEVTEPDQEAAEGEEAPVQTEGEMAAMTVKPVTVTDEIQEEGSGEEIESPAEAAPEQ